VVLRSVNVRQVGVWLTVVLLLQPCVPGSFGQVATQPEAKLFLTIVAGDNALANVRQRGAHDVVVQVDDDAHRPAPGAVVVFLGPERGAGAIFANGSNAVTTTTNEEGRVVLHGVTANQVAGKVEIWVTASKGGHMATATLTQVNSLPAAAAQSGGGSHKGIAILVALGGAAAAGAAIGLSHGKGSTSGAATPSPTPAVSLVTLVPGAPVVGPPR
jgi:hypothetical protein